jgi:hypothetical protein
MSSKVTLCALMLGASLLAHAESRVRTVPYAQHVLLQELDFDALPGKVAIDGDFSIVIRNVAGGRVAHLWQRDVTGQWTSRKTLLAVQTTLPPSNDDVVMANGVAALRIGNLLHIFERSGDTYLESDTAGTPEGAPGMAISGRSVLVARRGCNYDADLFEKSLGSGVWRVNGRIRGAVGECSDHGAALDLDGNVALVRNSPTEIREYRRSGTSLDWEQLATITPPAGAGFSLGAPTLSGNTAFVDDGRFFDRDATSWVYRGRVKPLDSADGNQPSGADYRGSLLITRSQDAQTHSESSPYLYWRNSGGNFDHVAVLGTGEGAHYMDVSGSRFVVQGQGDFGDITLRFFDLPQPLVAPLAIANDFDNGDLSGWQQEPGSGFSLGNSLRGPVYRQTSLVDKATTFLTASDWPWSQSIEADITPTAVNGSDRWVGLAVRYIDADNHYYVTLRSSNRLQLKRMVAGVFATLGDVALPFAINRTYHVKLVVNGPHLDVYVNGTWRVNATDDSLTHGRAALMTFRAQANFDNVYAGPTRPFTVALRDFGTLEPQGPAFTETGGTWTPVEQTNGTSDIAFGQTDVAADARAFIGTRTGDQSVESMIAVDSYQAASSGWVGLVARWVDTHTYYYLAIRSVGRLDIRKKVNGTITVLRTVPYTVNPGEYHRYRLAVVKNQLHAYVDDLFVAGAVDDEITKGQYGLGTYRATARFQTFEVEQP